MSMPERLVRSHFCGLLATAVMLPGIAGSVSATIYLDGSLGFLNRSGGQLSGTRAWVFGTALTIGAWILLAPLVRRFAYASRAIPSVYDDLRTEYDELKCRVDGLPQSDASGAACAQTHLRVVATDLGLGGGSELPSLRWTLATGYVASWRRLHRAREELLGAAAAPEVVSVAMEYRSRLKGSKIANAAGFVRELEQAILTLDPGLGVYLDAERPPAPSTASPDAGASGTQAAGGATGGATTVAAVPPGPAAAPGPPAPGGGLPPTDSEPDEVANARLVTRRIMRTIHEYRDSRRGGLVRSRNRLFATVIFAGSTAYAVLGLALVVNVGKTFVAAGVAFYLIGGVIGLFQQLRAASAADTVTEEDYGLSIARLIHTPLFSGIAAVAGVALSVLAPVAVPPSKTQTTTSAAATTTSASAAPAQTTTSPPAQTTTSPQATTSANNAQTGSPASLKQVFDIGNYPAGILVAAIFGLTPTLLIGRLQQQTEQYKAELRGTEAGEKHGESPESSA